MKTDIYIIRHGETDWNRAARMQGHADEPLNDLGREQAAQVAAALASYPLDAIYSSDLSRALDTARAIAAQHPQLQHLPVHTSALWRERDYGRFQGMTLPEVEAIDPHAAQQWRSRVADFAPDGGENLLQFQARIAQQLQSVAAQHAGQQQVFAVPTSLYNESATSQRLADYKLRSMYNCARVPGYRGYVFVWCCPVSARSPLDQTLQPSTVKRWLPNICSE